MCFLPATGIAMGIFGGKGIPFFDLYTVPGLAKPVAPVAKYSFKTHKLAGQALTYATPIHVGAAGYHTLKGEKILKRIL